MSDPTNPQNPGQTPPPPAPFGAQPTPVPQTPAPPYGAPAPQYGAPAPQYGAPAAPQYGAPAPQYGAPAPQYGLPAPTGKTPGLAIVGLVLAFVAAPVGLILSLVALPKTKRAGAGRGLAIAGAIIGALGTVVGIVVVALLAKGIGAVAGPAVAVTSFNHAIETDSCEEFFDVASEGYLASFGITDCAAFDQYAASVTDGLEDYRVSISGASVENGVTTVTTSETYTRTDDGSQGTDTYRYTMVQEDGSWKVDRVDLG